MKALITGSKGFIGKNLLCKLSGANFETRDIDLDDFYPAGWMDKLENILLRFHPDVIFHVGACSNTLETDVNYIMEVNYECTKLLCDWAKKNKKKIIYSSSAANYGQGNYPSNLYGWSKYVAEGYVVSNGGVGLRYFNVYGPGEEHKGRMSSVALQMFTKRLNSEEISLFPGIPTRDFVFIDDVVEANLFALTKYESLYGDWYDIGSYDSRSFEDVLISMGITNWSYTKEEDVPKGYQYFTLARKSMPGWKPKFTLEEGIKEYVKYLESHG